ncbi:hypothetical protein B296_00016538 [Ensete ventricosum]|uniref:Uncharacterized protein n=1 Tax=Ensete ventricosum TaxID=4639 RepID=A0A426YX35_ENSVE|nr:hypothetical protein B296_00016538 [Ensete ventricosum]
MSRRPCINASVAASRVALRAVARSVNRPTNWERGSSLPWINPKREAMGHLGTECNDVLCRIAAAIVRLEGREYEGGRERLALYLGSERGTAFRAFSNLPS